MAALEDVYKRQDTGQLLKRLEELVGEGDEGRQGAKPHDTAGNQVSALPEYQAQAYGAEHQDTGHVDAV